MTQLDRRSFLTAAGSVPLWLGLRQSGLLVPRGQERTLLVLELVGGNDGLNTVIPIDDERYARLRPKLSAVRKGAHRLPDGTALHPALGQLHRQVLAGQATVLHGAGYAQPDRSHFRSRDIWHVADPQHQRVSNATTGWLGRAADLLAAKADGVPAAAIGGLEVPLVLRSRRVCVPSLRRLEDFQWLSAGGRGPMPANAATRAVVAAQPVAVDPSDLRAFLSATSQRAVSLADDLTRALARYEAKAEYPDSTLGRDLKLVAQLVVSGFGTRLLHVGMTGFDTHARQLPTHAGLLAQLDAALAAFVMDLTAHGRADQVVVFVHSEFGRRAAENASQGTDHGAAAPAFVLLGGAAGGVLGAVPDLAQLDDGDPIATTDFRRIYRDLLQWLGLSPETVLDGSHATAGLWPVATIR